MGGGKQENAAGKSKKARGGLRARKPQKVGKKKTNWNFRRVERANRNL